MIRKRKYHADFQQLLKVLRHQQADRPVLFEYFVNSDLISYVNGVSFSELTHSTDQISAIVNFFHSSGYDYATIPSRYFNALSFQNAGQFKKNTVSLNEGFVITDRYSFDAYQWPNAEHGDFDLLLKPDILKDGMKFIVSAPGGVLENVISLVGFENLCFMLFEDETLVRDIFDAVSSRLLKFYEICSSIDVVGALIVNDDWGFKTQTMLSPETLRRYVFPWHKQIVEVIHANNKLAILHSCGNLEAIMEDIIIGMQYDAKHSFEDNILPVEEAWKKWHSKIGIVGGIDMDFLVRSSPEKIRKRSREMLELSGLNAYALGSGNSIPTYVPIENYLAMIEVVNS
jgi:uroporphyrinogen decarboxylase